MIKFIDRTVRARSKPLNHKAWTRTKTIYIYIYIYIYICFACLPVHVPYIEVLFRRHTHRSPTGVTPIEMWSLYQVTCK